MLRKLGAWAFLAVLIIGFIPFVSHNASATAPTITNYGVVPSYHEITSYEYIRFFLTYTDADNQAPDAGYPKGYRYLGVAWPAFTFVANDSGDTTYSDGKAYYYDYANYPVVGLTTFRFDVKSNGEAVVYKWPIALNMHIPSTPYPYHVFPTNNEPGEKTFTFNYTSIWGYPPIGVNVTIDGVSHSMIENVSGDVEYRNGKDFYFKANITSGLHNYSFEWTETSYSFDEKTTGLYWFLLEEPTMNISIGAIMLVGLIVACILILWVKH